MIVTAGSTNVSVYFYIVQDASASSPGEPAVGLLFSDIETGGSASYARQGAARVDLTLITLASASAAHDDGGFILVDDTNMPGLYRCDFPDAAFVTGVDQVFAQLVADSSNNVVIAPQQIDLTDADLRDSVRAGLTALPSAAADAAGGLAISDAGGLDLDQIATETAAILVDTAEIGAAGVGLTALPISPANITQINSVSASAVNLEASVSTIIASTATGTPSTTTMADTSLTESTDGHYVGRVIIWVDGDAAGIAAIVTVYTGSTNLFTFAATVTAATAGDAYVLI